MKPGLWGWPQAGRLAPWQLGLRQLWRSACLWHAPYSSFSPSALPLPQLSLTEHSVPALSILLSRSPLGELLFKEHFPWATVWVEAATHNFCLALTKHISLLKLLRHLPEKESVSFCSAHYFLHFFGQLFF